MTTSTRPAGDIAPLWEVIPRLFLCPLTGWGPVVLVLLAALLFFVGHWVVAILATLALSKYSIEILRNTADGRLIAPPVSYEVLVEDYSVPLKQILLVAPPILLMFLLTGPIGALVGFAFYVFYLVALPAAIMMLAQWDSLLAALNPVRLTALIRRIGWSYAVLYVFVLLLQTGPRAVARVLDGLLPPLVVAFGASLVEVFFTFVSYAMMGYVLYQRHYEIGYRVTAEITPRRPGRAAVAESFEDLVSQERYGEAKTLLEEMLRDDPDDPALRDKLATLERIVERTGGAREAALDLDYIGTLLESGQPEEAANAYLEFVAGSPGFAPAQPAHYPPLAVMLRKRGRYEDAIVLIDKLAQAHPDSELMPGLYLFAARILHEDMGQPDEARKIRAHVQACYPGHPGLG